MSTELTIKLDDDGNVYRGDKLIATVDGGVIKWKHYSYKAKHADEVGMLIHKSREGRNTASEPAEKVAKPKHSKPEPLKDFRGDLTPGYPEWFKEEHGQEEYDKRYIKHGRSRYKPTNEEEMTFNNRKGFISQ